MQIRPTHKLHSLLSGAIPLFVEGIKVGQSGDQRVPDLLDDLPRPVPPHGFRIKKHAGQTDGRAR